MSTTKALLVIAGGTPAAQVLADRLDNPVLPWLAGGISVLALAVLAVVMVRRKSRPPTPDSQMTVPVDPYALPFPAVQTFLRIQAAMQSGDLDELSRTCSSVMQNWLISTGRIGHDGDSVRHVSFDLVSISETLISLRYSANRFTVSDIEPVNEVWHYQHRAGQWVLVGITPA